MMGEGMMVVGTFRCETRSGCYLDHDETIKISRISGSVRGAGALVGHLVLLQDLRGDVSLTLHSLH
jgi:hypothetical protein